jgi:hypothetical protein
MTLLYSILLGLGVLALAGLNLGIWSWVWAVYAEARRDRRDKALIERLMEQQQTIAAQHAELRVLHGKAEAICAQMHGRC